MQENKTQSDVRTLYVTLLALGAAVGGFLFGYDTSTMNSGINGIRDTLTLSSLQVGMLAAISLLGAAVGAWFGGDLSVRFGRTRVMTVAGVAIAIGTLGVALSSQVWLIYVLRLVSGMGIGAASAVVPSYISEISPRAIRGRLGTLWQFSIVFGQLLGLLVGGFLTSRAGDEAGILAAGAESWRWMFGIVSLLGIAYIIIAMALPSSPHDLVRQGNDSEALDVFNDVNPPRAQAALAHIKESIGSSDQSGELSDLKGNAFGLKQVVWVGIGLAVFQQLVGINIVKTYSNTLWQSVGVPTDASFGVSVLTVFISLVATIIAILIMDRIGRRTLLLWGAVFMVLALGTMTIAFSQATLVNDEPSMPQMAGWAALIGMNVFAVAFGITWGPVMWIMLSEIFDSSLRTIAVAACTAINWVANWAVTVSYPPLSENLGLGFTYGLYTLFAIAAVVFSWRVLPETAEKEVS